MSVDPLARDRNGRSAQELRPASTNGTRPIKPEVKTLAVHLRRVIRTAPYESWEVDEEMEAAPDPNLTARQNLTAMRRLLTAEIEAACSELGSKNQTEEA